MNHFYKGKANYIFVSAMILALTLITIVSSSANTQETRFYKSLTTDTIPPSDSLLSDTIPVKDTIHNTIATIDTFEIKTSKDSLDGPVTYHADDSAVIDVPNNKIILYGKSTTANYLDYEITSPGMEFNQGTGIITAALRRDSTGRVIAFPTFSQTAGESKSVSDTIKFNMKTGRGITRGTYTQQGEIYVYGEKLKKIDAEVFYAYRTRFTTCNLDTPHFSFISKRVKFINQKMAVSGAVHPEFEGVPVPLYLPFGIFPLSKGRHSGLIAPTFGANEQMGLALEGLGYYKVLNDNWDVTLRTTLYSYGGWSAMIMPRYYKRYHYRGDFSFSMQNTKVNFKGDPDYSSTNTYNLRWSHNADTKARPGVTFGANLNLASSEYNQNVPNNPNRNFTNQLSSSIQFAKVWKDRPYNISLNANHNQNTNSKLINVTLPDMNFNLNTLYPFRRKEVIGSFKWYENLGIALNSNGRNATYFSDDDSVAMGKSIGNQITENMQWGISHNVPINLALPPVGPLQISPGVSYSERWYQKKTVYSWDDNLEKLDTATSKGFYTSREMAFSLSMATRIFGMFGFGKNAKVQAIRHEIRPSVSFSYKPDMNSKNYYTTQIDSNGNKGRYSLYSQNINGAFSEGKFGGMSFSIDNNLQMKTRNKKDTTAGATKKVTLIDGLSLSGNYNFLADSFALSVFSLSARTNLFDKISITSSATLDPYETDVTGRRIDRLVWKDQFSLGHFTSGSLSMASSFRGGENKGLTSGTTRNFNPQGTVDPYTGMPLDEYQTEAAYIANNPAEFADFNIPWSINLSYSLRFNRVFNQNAGDFHTIFSQDVNWNGTLNLTSKWQIGLNGYYNITTQELGTISISLARDLHCWQMAINISPVGRYRFFSISINPKSGLLRDLKVNRTRNFYDL